MHAVGDLARELERARAPMAPILIGIRSWTGRAEVNNPVHLKNSPSWSSSPSSRNVRITCIASRKRDSGRRLAQSRWYCSSITKFPIE